jgi:type IV pilus assembly protein PilE
MKTNGFTLIELVVAMAVVAILTAVAIPSYLNYIRQAREPDAKQAVLDLAAREERYYTLNNTYTSNAANLGYTGTGNVGVNLGTGSQPDYVLTVSASSATAYTLLATPLNDQLHDKCGSYQLDNTGSQLNIYPSTGTTAAPIPGCW